MKKFLKILLWVVIVIIVLLVIAGFVLSKMINLNDYKGKIEQTVYQKTGRHLTINGKISWHFFPTIGIKIGPAVLSNPAGYSSKTFASIQNASVSVHLWPLLSGRVEVGALTLNGFKLNLIQKNPKNNNWTFKTKPKNTQKIQLKKPTQSEPSESSTVQFSVHQINITNAQVQYVNHTTQAHYLLKNFRFHGVDVGLGHLFPMSLSFNVSSNQPAAQARISLQAQLKIDQKLQEYDLHKMTLRSSLIMQRPKQKPLTLDGLLAGQAHVNLPKQTLTIQANWIFNNILKLSGKAAIQQLFSGLSFKGQLNIHPFDINPFLTSIGDKAIILPNKKALTHVSAHLIFQGNQDNLALTQIQGTLHNSTLTGRLRINHFAAPTLTTKLALNTIDVSDYVDLKGAALPIDQTTLTANLRTAGLSKKVFPSTLQGNILFNFKQATLKGVDIDAALQAVNKIIKGMFDPSERGHGWSELQAQFPAHAKRINPHNGKMTDLGTFILGLNIQKGVGTISQGHLNNPQFQANMTGHINLNKRTLNILTWLYQTQKVPADAQQRNVPPQLKIPYRIHGAFSKLRYGVDWPALQKQVGAYLTEALKQGVGQALQQEAGKLLQNVFH